MKARLKAKQKSANFSGNLVNDKCLKFNKKEIW